MDEPVPVRRAVIGCLLVAAAVVVLALLARPAIFSVAPPRDDSAVVVATATEVAAGPIRREVLLSRSHGWSGERDAGDGRVQLTVIVSQPAIAAVAAVNAASPGRDDCPIEIGADRLLDCDGRAWTFEGIPLDPADPTLERIAARLESGGVVLDLTGPVDE